MSGGIEPWWLAIAGGAASTLIGAIGKLWAENKAIRRELADANARIVALQLEGASEHRRDLRRIAGLSTSLAPRSPLEPPIIIREALPPPRKQRPQT